MKTCKKCLQTKAETEFHVRRASPDGLAYKCRACVNAYTKEWQARNPEAFREWASANAEKRAAYMQDWHKEHQGERSESYREWRLRNRPVVAARNAARKTAKASATPAWSDLGAIREFYVEAARLTAETGIQHEVDHIVPLKGVNVCGLHVDYNLQILTRAENARKRNKMPSPPVRLGAGNFSVPYAVGHRYA